MRGALATDTNIIRKTQMRWCQPRKRDREKWHPISSSLTKAFLRRAVHCSICRGMVERLKATLSKHSPCWSVAAAHLAEGPACFRWRTDPPNPRSLTSCHRLCPPDAQMPASRWCCPWHWPQNTQNLRIKEETKSRLRPCSKTQWAATDKSTISI